MSRKNYIKILSAGVVLLLLCLIYIAVRGDTYVIRYQIPRNLMVRSVEDFQVRINQPKEAVSLKEARIENGELVLTVEAVSQGRAYVITQGPQNYSLFTALYSHRFGIITKDT